jgi:hypothetical protein
MFRRKPIAPNTIQAAPTAIRIPVGISSHSTIHQTSSEYAYSLLQPRAGAIAQACFEDGERLAFAATWPDVYPAANGNAARPRIDSIRENVRSR